MEKNEGGADGSFRMGEEAVWDTGSPDHECDCPGPPPRFHLPPPPRPYNIPGGCPENATSPVNTCEAVPVIDAEYHYSPTMPSLAIILTIAAAVVVFFLLGTLLVLLKKRKMHNLLPRKSSPQNRSDAASANGVIYEDLTNLRTVRPRVHCPLPPGQTTLPSIEMMNAASYADPTAFAPVLMCSSSPLADGRDTRELFNPVYEELSNGSGDGGETDSEGTCRGAGSEEEFAEDELSLGGEAGGRRRGGGRPGVAEDVCREVDSSDSDDKCKFLENPSVNLSPPPDRRDRRQRTSRDRESYFGGVDKKAKTLDRRKVWRRKARSPMPLPPVVRSEFHEGFLLKRIMQIYPDVTGMGLQYSSKQPKVARPENPSDGGGRYESPDAFSPARLRPLKPEIFSTFGPVQGFQKNQSQDSSLGSDSGYSNNTSGDKSSKTRKEYPLTKCSGNTALS